MSTNLIFGWYLLSVKVTRLIKIQINYNSVRVLFETISYVLIYIYICISIISQCMKQLFSKLSKVNILSSEHISSYYKGFVILYQYINVW